jgi:site-specific DNA-methyltransferase (adenine-specific)
MAVGDLQFDPANARTHGEDNLAAIRASLRAYGQRKPVVVNRRTGLVEAGNGTLQAALSLGWTHVAALFVDDDPTAAAGFSIADNRTAELADWSKEALDKLLRDVQTDDEDLASMFDELAKDMKLVPGDQADPKPPEPEPEATGSLTCPSCGHHFTAAQLLG